MSALFQQFWFQNLAAPISAHIVTIASVALWIMLCRFAWRKGQHNTVALVVATIFCLGSEYLAIQFGKYHYAQFALSLPEIKLPDLVVRLLNWLASWKIIPPVIHVEGVSRHVPVEIALLEGALLFAVFRLTNFLSPQKPLRGLTRENFISWFAARWPNPVLNGFLALSLDAMLDPVVAGTMPVAPLGPASDGLALWTWHTTPHYAGHWFGVPLANYNAWFAALFAFTVTTRITNRSTEAFGVSLFRQGKVAIGAAIRTIGFLMLLLFAIKFTLDYLTYEAFGLFGEHTPAAWQFAIQGVMVAFGILAAARIAGRAIRTAKFELETIAPIVFVFAYSAGALVFAGVYEREPLTLPLWIVTLGVAAIHASAPWRWNKLPLGEPAGDPRAGLS